MKLYIMLLTYASSPDDPRGKYAEMTLSSVLNKLDFDGQVSVHIADDGSYPGYRERLIDIAGGYNHVKGVTVTDGNREGYGHSYNLATQVVHAFGPDVILPLEDDWTIQDGPNGLTPSLNTTPFMEDLLDDERINCIRFGYLGFTQSLKGEVIASPSGQKYLLFDPDSAERHVFAGHPRFETLQFERNVGPWPEGLDPGTTEFVVSGYAAARHGVVWPLDIPQRFVHIGAVQARQDQK